ncbi:gp58-like family protein, partial [Leuconostoc lactis]|uniref:gp58-like family protein n=1 Tax=Leuconostoc lactis TaxID=1246 RepID=UPI0021A5B0FB
WTRVSSTGTATGTNAIIIYFNSKDVALDVYIKLPKLETGTIPTAWTPAPEDTENAIAQVKHTADSISNFVRDSSGNISSDFQTALSKTSIITGSTLATSIQKQTATQITQSLTDNNGKIISLINQDSSGVQIAGKNIVLDGNTTVTGDFYAKGGNFKNLNASNLTVGTLNGNQVNITNINADNIVSGAISGANLNINLNTGSVVFQKGRINSSDYTTDINIDQGYISTANSDTRAILKNGQLQLTSPNYYDLQTNPYLSIYNDPRAFDSTGKFNSAVISARDRVIIGNKDGLNSMFLTGDTYYLGQSSFYGLSSGKTIGNSIPTVVGGGATGVVLVGGSTYTNTIGGNDSPSIIVGWSPDSSVYSGNRIRIEADYFHVGAVYNRTTSSSSNVVVAADGAIVRSSSARKYKLDIKNDIPIADSLKLIDVPLSTWVDKHEHEENGSNERYFGMIAEDLRDAGLEYLVQYGKDNEVEGINYDRVALLLIPLVKELKERIEDLESKGK